MKRFLAGLLALVMVLCFVGCGSSAPDDPNCGLYTATEGEMMGITVPVEDIWEGGFTIELKGGGKCTLVVDGTSENDKYTLENGAVHIEGRGFELDGTVADGTMILEDVMGSGVQLTLVK